MTLPGFTAQSGLNDAQQHYRNGASVFGAHRERSFRKAGVRNGARRACAAACAADAPAIPMPAMNLVTTVASLFFCRPIKPIAGDGGKRSSVFTRCPRFLTIGQTGL